MITVEAICFAMSIVLIISVAILLFRYDKSIFSCLLFMLIDKHSDEEAACKTAEAVNAFRLKLKNFKNTLHSTVLEEYEAEMKRIHKEQGIGRILEEYRRRESKKNKKEKSNNADIPINVINSLLDTTGKRKSLFFNKIEQDEKHEDKGEIVEENIITNKLLIHNCKTYNISYIKIARILIFLIFAALVIMSAINIVTSNNNFENFKETNVIADALITRFSIYTQLLNNVRLSLFKNVPYDEYETLLEEISIVDKNYTNFINNYSGSLTKTWTFGNLIIQNIDTTNEEYLCEDATLENLCRLNQKGIDDGIDTTILTIKTVYRDFLKLYPNYSKKNLIDSFNNNNDMFNLINLELEKIFWKANSIFTTNIGDDMDLIFSSVYNSVMLLGIVSLLCNILIVIYLMFGFLRTLKRYLSEISYSCGKFNNSLFN